MGDKGGRKDKNKAAKHKRDKDASKAKRRKDKQPKPETFDPPSTP